MSSLPIPIRNPFGFFHRLQNLLLQSGQTEQVDSKKAVKRGEPDYTDYGLIVPTDRVVFLGDMGLGKTLAMIGRTLKLIHENPEKKIFTYGKIYDGDPYSESVEVDWVTGFHNKQLFGGGTERVAETEKRTFYRGKVVHCEGKCPSCQEEIAAIGTIQPHHIGHRFQHSKRFPFRYWNEIADHDTGIENLDEIANHLPSEKWDRLDAERFIWQNARKKNLDFQMTVQSKTVVAKKIRDVTLTVIRPVLHIARVADRNGVTKDGLIDFNNENVRNHIPHPTDNCLELQYFYEQDGNWEKSCGDSTNGVPRRSGICPDRTEIFEIVPSVLLDYYPTREIIDVPFAPALSQEEGQLHAQELYDWFKESKSYLWFNYISVGEDIPSKDFVPAVTAWNDFAYHHGRTALLMVQYFFNQLLSDFKTLKRKSKTHELFACDCGKELFERNMIQHANAHHKGKYWKILTEAVTEKTPKPIQNPLRKTHVESPSGIDEKIADTMKRAVQNVQSGKYDDDKSDTDSSRAPQK